MAEPASQRIRGYGAWPRPARSPRPKGGRDDPPWRVWWRDGRALSRNHLLLGGPTGRSSLQVKQEDETRTGKGDKWGQPSQPPALDF